MGVEKFYWDYNELSIDNVYNNIPVYWCDNCKSLMVSYFECDIQGMPDVYCVDCGSFGVKSGNIFD